MIPINNKSTARLAVKHKMRCPAANFTRYTGQQTFNSRLVFGMSTKVIHKICLYLPLTISFITVFYQ